jgi:predicted phage terminase large subunit-like protein
MTNKPNWNEVLEYLTPKETPFCPEEPSINQKVFLRTNSLEALFGGAAGGGKSSALLMAALQYVDVPGYSAILFRRTYADLALPGALMDRFVSWMSNYDDVSWNRNSFIATFPSGARISFGYLNNANDYLRYKGCTTPDTEVLTISGWKLITEVKVGELVASMNPETREWDYEPVTHFHEYDHDGNIYSPREGSDVSFAVTPNHSWWVSTQKVDKLRKYRTDELPKVARFPQAGHFVGGINPESVSFPRSSRGFQRSSSLLFSSEDWATFLGWYIAEGSSSKGSINIALHDSHSRKNKDNLKALIERAGGHVRDTDRNLIFTNTRLADWLEKHTGKGAYNKRIPDEVFTWKTRYARILLESLVEGDGTWRTNKNGHYVTVSEELAHAVMRLASHCGFRATLDVRHDKTTTPDSKTHNVKAFHVYLLETADRDTGISLNTDNSPLVSAPYKGKVYCLTVPPHHTFLTRHNGRMVWTGNSEFQFIGMDEVTEIRESDYRYLFSRLRRPANGPVSQIPLRMRCASNPAPNWVRQRFIVEGRSEGRIFVPSTLKDNPGIDADSYRQALQALDPVERRRLEEGDWWSTTLGSLFDRTSFVVIDGHEIPEITSAARVVRYWDLAATEPNASNPDPDWTVGTLMLFDGGIAYVLDVRKARVRGEKVEHLIAQTAIEDGHGVSIRMEQEPGSSGKALMDQYARYVVPGYDFGAIRPTGDKVTRARPFAAAAANGNVRLVRAPWLSDWLDEFSSFPESANHDDQVDSAVGAFTYLAGLGLPQRKRVSILI